MILISSYSYSPVVILILSKFFLPIFVRTSNIYLVMKHTPFIEIPQFYRVKAFLHKETEAQTESNLFKVTKKTNDKKR